MKWSFEIPISLLNLDRSDHLFVLQPYLKYEEYLKYVKSSTKMKIIDNTANEGFVIDIQKMVEDAFNIKSNIIVVQDHLMDYEKTKEEIDRWDEYIKREKIRDDFKWMYVIQGRNEKEFKKLFDYVKDRADYIGVPYMLYSLPINYYEIWNYIVSYIGDENKNNGIKIHQLGVGNYEILRRFGKFIESADTSLPVNYAVNRYSDFKNYKKFKGVKITDNIVFDKAQLKIYHETINFLRSLEYEYSQY
jgi:hypothetical protein